MIYLSMDVGSFLDGVEPINLEPSQFRICVICFPKGLSSEGDISLQVILLIVPQHGLHYSGAIQLCRVVSLLFSRLDLLITSLELWFDAAMQTTHLPVIPMPTSSAAPGVFPPCLWLGRYLLQQQRETCAF